MANLMNMSRQGISHWENGRTLPDAETLKKLSQVLNYNFEEPEFTGGTAPVEAAAEETPVVLEAPKSGRRQYTAVLCIICLAAGLAVGFLMGYLAAPKFVNHTLAIPINTRSSDAAQAALSIYKVYETQVIRQEDVKKKRNANAKMRKATAKPEAEGEN